MFPWSKSITKSVTFNQDLPDQSLLEVVESELEKQPHKTFSDLCKEALWQSLCVPESVRPSPKTAAMETAAIEQQMAELQRQFADFEQRFFARESSQLEAMQRQLNQLSQQLSQLVMVNQRPTPQPPTQLESAQEEVVSPTIVQIEVDPELSRLSQLLDDF